MLTSDEEISKIEKAHLFNDFSRNALSFLMKSSMALLKTCVKCRAVALGYANAQPPGRYKISKPHPRDWERKQISAPRLPGGEWSLLEFTDALEF